MNYHQALEKCDHCSEVIVNRKYCYDGICYCRSCFSIYSSYKLCTSCDKRKRILNLIEPPVCQECRLKSEECIRCGKEKYNLGKITASGPVCTSCSVYFREFKRCVQCNKTNKTVNNRIDGTGSNIYLCQSCYNKTLPLCSHCKYRKKPFLYDLHKKPLCKICATEGIRYCKLCKKPIHAGYGHQCINCSSKKTIKKRIAIGKKLLSKFFSNEFELFCKWLEKRRGGEGVVFVATHILKYLDYFIELDKLALELNQRPSYRQVVKRFSVAKTRKYLLVSIFLNDLNIIPINNNIKEEYSNLGMIDRLLGKFRNDAIYENIILNYYSYLLQKQKNKASIRSIRLALGQAVALIAWCEHFSLKHPTNELLYGFLWHSPGRRAGLTGFINYLNHNLQLDLVLPSDNELIFIRPCESNKYLKIKLLSSLRAIRCNNAYEGKVLEIAIAYLHGIRIPKYVWLQKSSIKKNKKGYIYIKLLKKELYLPKEIYLLPRI